MGKGNLRPAGGRWGLDAPLCWSDRALWQHAAIGWRSQDLPPSRSGSGCRVVGLLPGGEGELEDAPAVAVLVGEVAGHEVGELAGDTEPDPD